MRMMAITCLTLTTVLSLVNPANAADSAPKLPPIPQKTVDNAVAARMFGYGRMIKGDVTLSSL